MNQYSTLMKLLTYLQQIHWLARRTLTDLIQKREIMLNGVVVDNFLVQVTPWDQYLIVSLGYSGVVSQIDRRVVHLVLFYKPEWYTVSKSDSHNDTIFDITPSDWKSTYYPIGRLDKNSCGLLLLTDELSLVHQLWHPRYQHQKVYHVRLKQQRNPSHAQQALSGVLYSDPDTGVSVSLSCAMIRIISWWVEIVLEEWKNRHIRKMLSVLWYDIIELKRIAFGPFQLGDMRPWEYRIYRYESSDALWQKMAWQGQWNL